MERRSRSQVRRVENGLAPHSRHVSSSRLEQGVRTDVGVRPEQPEQSRTLSPDRKDRYRSSGRGPGFPSTGFPITGFPNYTSGYPGHPPPSDNLVNHPTPHSNSNSYNQYTMNPYGEVPPPRPTPPSSSLPLTIPPSQSSPLKPSNLSQDNAGQLNLAQAGERIAWELHHVTLNRVSGFGFGIAVSGGRDNPHFSNGDTSIAISDVLKGGPAEGKLMINDRVISANKISLEGVDYATAVQVLRDSGQSVNLVVKRRIVLPAPPEPQNIRVSLVKTKKKDDFGIILGCKIYIKEISGRSLADKEGSLQVGDLIQKLNSLSVDGLSLKETRKVLESAKEKLEITVQRDPYRSPLKTDAAESRLGENLYSSPPRKDGKGRYEETTPPSRPPPPKESVDYGITPRNKDDSSHSSKSKTNLPDPRFISFQKDGSVGIRLTGGNDSGIFVTAVQPGSPAAQQGLQPGDKIIKVNDMDMSGVTREEAVLYLLSLQDQIDLIVQYRKEEYEQIVQNQRGDSFYIKAHFNYEQPDKGEMTFKKCDVFHVVDTLHNGVVGAWQAFRMDPFLSGLGRAAEQVQKGVIPNKSRAEEIATKQFNAAKKEQSVSEQNKGSFFKRKRTQNHRRSKSLGKDHWEDLVWSESMSKFPAYERVSLRHPGFPRPVVIFGAVADIARERLLRDFPLKFASPQQDSSASLGSGAGLENKKSGIVRLSAIRDIMERGLHALLDVTPNAVDKLNYAQFYPIVLLARADSKQTIKECRAGLPKRAHLPSRKLLEQSQKIEKLWGHSLTGTLHLHADNWYNKITDLIEKQQTAPIWMSDAKPDESFSDDFLFPMSSRLSYSSYPESDGEFCGEDSPRKGGTSRTGTLQDSSRLFRATSDPNLARKDGTMKSESGVNIPDFSIPQQQQQQGSIEKRESQSGDKFGFKLEESPASSNQDKYGSVAGDKTKPGPVLPPKIDRQKKPSKKSAAERLFGHRAQHSPPEESPSPGYGSTNSNSNSFNAHSAEGYDSYGKRTADPGYASSQISRNPGGQNYPPQQNGTPTHQNGIHAQTNGIPPPINGNPLPQNGIPPSQNGMTPTQNGTTPPQNGMNGYASTGKPLPPSSSQDKYRYSEYKPMPPPKSSVYKPVPPPKPKPFSSTPSHPSHPSQPASLQESNYMNGNYIQESDYPNSYHYHSSRVVDNYQPSPPRLPPFDDVDSNGVDSGQGSSLDRDYSSYNRYNGPPPPRSQGQYYYNLPTQREEGGQGGVSPRRRAPGDTLDLSNREYRGSAFELYKKPGYQPFHGYGEVPR